MSGQDLRGRRVLVVGLARSGLATVEFLLRRGAKVRATDLKPLEELPAECLALKQQGAELVLGSHPGGLCSDVDLVVTSPGVPLSCPPLEEARARGVPVWGELELGYRHVQGPVVAVTGTKGKSTTATLIAKMLERAGRSVKLGGNIGKPLVGLVDGAGAGDVFVLEVSSFQLETTKQFRPHVAVLLDVSPDHLDWHPSFEAYVEAKKRIFARQEAGDWAVVYAGNPLTVDMASKARSKKVYFSYERWSGETPTVAVEGPWIVKRDDGETTHLAPLARVRLRGRHNVENVLAACAAAGLLGLDPELLELAIGDFAGVPHALERVGELEGVAFYNDSKATNLVSAKAALASFEGGVILILGGRPKAGDFAELRPHVEGKVKAVMAIGEAQRQIQKALADLVPVVACGSMGEAVRAAFGRARGGETVLLAPACASFDMFRDYVERGERFREEFEKLRQQVERKGKGARDNDETEEN